MSLKEELEKLRAFDAKQNDYELVRQKWPGPKSGYACADYFTRGRYDQFVKDQKLFQLLCEVAEAAEPITDLKMQVTDMHRRKIKEALAALKAHVAGE